MTISGGNPPFTNDRYLTSGEVAAIFRVDAKTVTRWAAKGKLPFIKTPGGHRRFRQSIVMAILNNSEEGLNAKDA